MCGKAGAGVVWMEGVGDNRGFTPGLAACGRIWGVCAPDVGTPLCAAGWLIFITAHNDGAREWGLGWKRHGETKERRAAEREKKKRKREGRRAENNRGGEIKGTVERKNSASSSYSASQNRAARYPNHVHKSVKCNCGAVPSLIRARMVHSCMLLHG